MNTTPRVLPALLLAAAPLLAQGATYRISTTSQAQPVNGRNLDPSPSGDGLLIAFTSFATDLVPGDTNGMSDVFVKDLVTGQVQRVSVATGGAEANGPSRHARISADGRFVAFESDATNLVAGDTNAYTDVFLFDRQTARTTRVSTASNGMQGDLPSSQPAVSGDGRYVAFLSMATNLVQNDTNNYLDVFVHDRLLRQTVRASVSTQNAEADDDCYAPAISDDGRWVAWNSAATSLVANDTNLSQDVFVRDLLLGQTERVSVGPGGAQANGDSLSCSIGAGGRWIAFHSHATNLVPGDTNGFVDVFRVDRNTMLVERASVDSLGMQGQGDSLYPSLSDDGLRVAFVSDVDSFVQRAGPFPDVFVHDFGSGRTSIHSLSSDGLVASDWNGNPALSGNGRYVAWPSLASNIVPNDTNAVEDVLVNEVSHHMVASGFLRLGQTTTLTLSSPRDAGKIHVCLAAFNTQFGIQIGGRLFPLDNDPLLQACLGAPGLFANFIGTLDAAGGATASIVMPNLAYLSGFEMVVGYTVLDPAFPTGFSGMGNAIFFQAF